MYSRPLKIYREVDNLVTVELRNNDQKPIDTAGKVFTFVVKAGGNDILEEEVTITDANTAVGTFTITSADAGDLLQDNYNYAIRYTDNGLTLPAYVDDNWGATGQMIVKSGF